MATVAELIAVADSFVGNIQENPPGSNCTPLGVEFGENCVEWCSIYCSICFRRVGQPAFDTASVAAAIAAAQAGTNGMQYLPANATVAAGDVAIFDFGGHGNPADFHNSIVRDPMTQTNFQTDGGNESNQVLQRVVDRTFVTGFIRPAYSGGGGGGTGPVQGIVSCGLTAVSLSGFEAEFFVFQSIGQGTGGGGGGTGPGGSGTISYAEAEGYWIAAGGDPNLAAIAAAITVPESSTQPGEIEQIPPATGYGDSGWGLWQITPGNSFAGDPNIGQDYQLLDPLRNARAAVRKHNDAGGFGPWTTYPQPALSHLQTGVPPAQVGDPGQFIPIGSAPSGTHNTSMPGSTA